MRDHILSRYDIIFFMHITSATSRVHFSCVLFNWLRNIIMFNRRCSMATTVLRLVCNIYSVFLVFGLFRCLITGSFRLLPLDSKLWTLRLLVISAAIGESLLLCRSGRASPVPLIATLLLIDDPTLFTLWYTAELLCWPALVRLYPPLLVKEETLLMILWSCIVNDDKSPITWSLLISLLFFIVVLLSLVLRSVACSAWVMMGFGTSGNLLLCEALIGCVHVYNKH